MIKVYWTNTDNWSDKPKTKSTTLDIHPAQET